MNFNRHLRFTGIVLAVICGALITSQYFSRAYQLVPQPAMQLGRQLALELYDCDPALIDNVEHVEATLLQAAREAHATIIDHKFHKFSPQGVSGVVVIGESHIAIHTWPEYGYCAIDLFTCGHIDNEKAFEVMQKGFNCKRIHKALEIKRGLDTVPTI